MKQMTMDKIPPIAAIRNKDHEIINFPTRNCYVTVYKMSGGKLVNALQGQSMILCLDGKCYLPSWKGSNEYFEILHDLPGIERQIQYYRIARFLTHSEAHELMEIIIASRIKMEPTGVSANGIPEILVRYHKSENTDDPIIELEQFHIGDWIDLRSRDEVYLQEGEHAVIKLSVSMQLPPEYEGLIAARSSTWLEHGVLYASSIGVIDNSYCGDDDIWHMPVYATRDTIIKANERICQFRIQKRMGKVRLKTVEKLEGANRGGFGHTGRM